MKFKLMALTILIIILSISPSAQHNQDQTPKVVKWEHLASLYRDLPFADVGSQLSALIMDINKDGLNDFVIAGWDKPSMV